MSPVIVLVVALDSQEGVCEDVYEGHSDGRTQPAVKIGIVTIFNLAQKSYLPFFKYEAGCVW